MPLPHAGCPVHLYMFLKSKPQRNLSIHILNTSTRHLVVTQASDPPLPAALPALCCSLGIRRQGPTGHQRSRKSVWVGEWDNRPEAEERGKRNEKN